MGFFDDAANTFKKVAHDAAYALPVTGGLTSAGLGGAAAGDWLRQQFQNEDKAPDAPQIDPRIKAIKDAQSKQASDFKQNETGLETDLYSNFRNQRLGDLAGQMHKTNTSLGKRGLLYGGIAEGAKARNQANASYDLGTAKAGIKREVESMGNQLDADAINSGMLLQRTSQDIQDTIYNKALQEYQNQNQMNTGLAQGIGTGVGYGLASIGKYAGN